MSKQTYPKRKKPILQALKKYAPVVVILAAIMSLIMWGVYVWYGFEGVKAVSGYFLYALVAGAVIVVVSTLDKSKDRKIFATVVCGIIAYTVGSLMYWALGPEYTTELLFVGVALIAWFKK